MRTPRNTSRSRGIGTLIGNGWLRESPRNVLPREWHAVSRSAMRKCMFLPAAPELQAALPPISPAALPPPAPRAPAPIVARRRDPARDVREMPAIDPVAAQRAAYAKYARAPVPGEHALAWWEDPLALGTLLVLVPPIGLAAVWSSRRYSSDARWALTVMTALTMCLGAAVVIVLAMR